MRYIVEKNFVQVLGKIWMPACQAAMEYPLDSHAVECIGEFTRENVEQWLCTHSGDFQSIQDFCATVGDEWIPWEFEDSEWEYGDLMYPSEE